MKKLIEIPDDYCGCNKCTLYQPSLNYCKLFSTPLAVNIENLPMKCWQCDSYLKVNNQHIQSIAAALAEIKDIKTDDTSMSFSRILEGKDSDRYMLCASIELSFDLIYLIIISAKHGIIGSKIITAPDPYPNLQQMTAKDFIYWLNNELELFVDYYIEY